jgi:hypothetical protein
MQSTLPQSVSKHSLRDIDLQSGCVRLKTCLRYLIATTFPLGNSLPTEISWQTFKHVRHRRPVCSTDTSMTYVTKDTLILPLPCIACVKIMNRNIYVTGLSSIFNWPRSHISLNCMESYFILFLLFESTCICYEVESPIFLWAFKLQPGLYCKWNATGISNDLEQ